MKEAERSGLGGGGAVADSSYHEVGLLVCLYQDLSGGILRRRGVHRCLLGLFHQHPGVESRIDVALNPAAHAIRNTCRAIRSVRRRCSPKLGP